MKTVQELFDLTGKVAIVTGAGSGLGVVFSEALAEAGATVVCSDIEADHAKETAESLAGRGFHTSSIQADVAKDGDVVAMIQHALHVHGRLDILVNNAGIAVAGPAEDLVTADWQRVIDVNLTGVFICAREAAKAMIEAGRGGKIVNIASILGAVASQPFPAPAYDAAKGAVVNLTRSLGVHWAPKGINVNAIGPAYFPSAMTGPFLSDPEIVAEISRRTPLGRIGRPEELKGAIVYLASEASSYVTGQTLYVDGGWTAW